MHMTKKLRPSESANAAFTLVVLAGLACLTDSSAVAQETTGNAQRGETLFTTTYKCYACHGYDAQTGQRRLKPMNYTQAGFTTFVQNSPLPLMPAYPDVGGSDLADIYAYVLSIPVDAPEVTDIPLLRSILEDKLRAIDD